MSLEELKTRQTNLILQRSQAKDIIEQCERQLQAVSLGIQVLEEDTKAREEALADSGVVKD